MKPKTQAAVVAGLFATIAGCTLPASSLLEKKAQRPVAKSTPSRSRSARPQQASSGPVYELRVNDETLTAQDLWSGERERLATVRGQGRKPYKQFLEREAARRIPDRITEMLLYQHAARLIPETAEAAIEKEVDGQIRRIITSEHGGVQRRFERSLQGKGSSIEQVRGRIRREMLITNFLQQEIKSQLSEPTRAELHAIFDREISRWRRPEKRKMSVIEVRIDEAMPQVGSPITGESRAEVRAKAKAKASELLRRINGGEAFEQLAKTQSDGLRASDGGSWGWVDRESVRERFLPAIDALGLLKQGEVSPIIPTPEAFFLVRCDELISAYEPSFTDVQVELKQKWLSQGYNKSMKALIAGLRRKARIDPPDLERFHAGAVEVALEDGFLATR